MALILIVDDRAINRQFLSTLLGYAGHTPLEAEDGEAALIVAHQQRPDLVISDILMPNMDGMQLARHLHDDPQLSNVPIIFYTATYRLRDAHNLAAICGVAKVLAKPSEPQIILDAVAEVLGADARTIATQVEPVPAPNNLDELQLRLRKTVEQGLVLANEQIASPHLRTAIDDVQTLSLRLATMLELSAELNAQRDPQELLELACRAAQDIMSAHYCAAGMLDDEWRLVRCAVRGLPETIRQAFYAAASTTGILAAAIGTGKSCHVRDGHSEWEALGLPTGHPPVTEMLVLPVRSSERTYGWLYVADKLDGQKFDDTDEEFATTLAALLAQAYENRCIFEQAKQYADRLEVEIAEHRLTLAALGESESRFRQLAENIHEVFYLITADYSETLYISPTFEAIWGKSCAHLYAHPNAWMESIHPDDLPQVLTGIQHSHESGYLLSNYRIVRADGSQRWIQDRTFPIRDGNGVIYRLAGIAEDVTESREQADKIARLSRITNVMSEINSAIVRIRDSQELFGEVCRIAVDKGGFLQAWIGEIGPGSDEGEVVAFRSNTLDPPEIIPLTNQPGLPHSEHPACVALREGRAVIRNDITEAPLLWHLLEHGKKSVAAFPLLIDGRPSAVLVLFSAEAGFFDQNELRLLNELAGDISFGLHYMERERQLAYLALYDPLTGLPNRTLFQDRLSQYLTTSTPEDRSVVVVVANIDRFQQINDMLGRHIGDELLRQAAKCWTQALREPYCLARLEADSFAVAVADLPAGADALTILRDRIDNPLAQPFQIGDHQLRLSITAGIALFPHDGETAENLLDNAESALRQAKINGEQHLYYDPATNVRMREKLFLEAELRKALETGQFILHYQPQVDLVTGHIIGAEALIRWHHPQLGMVSPTRFIPLAEETGLIIPIGDWVIHTVCAQQALWQARQLPIVPVALNLSALQFGNDRLQQVLRHALDKHGIEAKYLELELTESAVMQSPDQAIQTLNVFRNMGLRLSLDDFGTGYSSLAYLKRFPFDVLKIDRAFITDITRNAEDAAIATAVITIAHRLGLRTIAEGVETEEQLRFLQRHGCDEIQGFYFSQPLPADAFATLLLEGRRLDTRQQVALSERTLLLVDDDPSMLATLRRLLRSEGYNLLSATSAEEGLQLLALHAAQVIVTDQRMPGMSGAEFLDLVKELYPDTIRIVLSGYTDLKAVIDSVNRGSVYKFLTKPWDDDLLREQIRDAFRRYRSE